MFMNIFSMMKDLGQLQSKMQEMKEQLKDFEETGCSGGGLVKIKINGTFSLISVELDPIVVDNRDIKMLQDLIVAAHNDAMQKMQEKLQETMGPMAQGLL